MARQRIRSGPSGPPIDGTQLGQIVQWDGTQWVPGSNGSAVGQLLQWNGSLWIPVGTTPSNGEVPVWNSGTSQWEPGSLAPPATPEAQLLFEWNGLDTTQFNTTPVFASAGTTPSISVVGDLNAPTQNKLRLGSSTGTGEGIVVWAANDALVLPSGRRRLRFQIHLIGLDTQYGGISFMGDTTGNYHGLQWFFGASAWASRVDDGVANISGSTTGGNLASTTAGDERWIEMDVLMDKDIGVGGRPYGLASGFTRGNQLIGGARWTLEDQIAAGWGAFGASWATLECLEWGVAIQANAAQAYATAYDIGMLRVLSLPGT